MALARDDKGNHDGQSRDSLVFGLVSPVSPHEERNQPPDQQPDQQPGQRDADTNRPEVYVETSPLAVWPKETQNSVSYDHGDKYAVNDGDTFKVALHRDPTTLGVEAYGDFPPGAMAAVERDLPPDEPAKNAKILGLKRRTFFIALAILLIVIAAAVGGGVGGSLASSSNSDSSSPDDAAATSNSDPPITTPTPTSSGPSDPESTTDLLTETEPDDTFAFQAWRSYNFTGTVSPIVREIGETDLDFSANSYIWKPSKNACCVSFCNGTSYDGEGVPDWICSERYRREASGPFKRIFVWCGEERITENSRCSDL